MPHGKLVRNPVTGWTDGSTVTPDEIEALVAGLAGAVNGDDGSTHAPPVQLVIDGAGMTLQGPLVIARGGVLETTSDIAAFGSATITNSDGDWPQIAPGSIVNNETRMIPCATGRGELAFTWNVRRENGGLQAFSPMFDASDGLGMRPSRAWMRLRAHDNATISSVAVYFHVGWPHTDLPSIMPSVRVLRVDAFGNGSALTSVAAGADASGYVFVPRPTTPAAWFNLGLQKQLVVPCDQNNVIDAANYDYVIEFVEEQGLKGYPWQLTYTVPAFIETVAPVVRSGTQAVRTVLLKDGSTVLVKDQADPRENGLYIVNSSGAWPRWDILGTSADFIQGLVVPIVTPVDSGSPITTFRSVGTFFQVSSSITAWTPDKTPLIFLPAPDMSFPFEGSGFFGHGILWQQVQPVYSRIPDLRPQ